MGAPLDDRGDLCLPEGYRRNPQASADAAGTPYWEGGTADKDLRYQDPVYRWAAQLARERRWRMVVDVGCGTGHKLVRRIAPVADVVGVDQPSAIDVARATFPGHRFLAGDLGGDALWAEVAGLHPDLVLSADVIEHLDEPGMLLDRLRTVVEPDGHVLISTPDRALMDGAPPLGPPTNPRHVREWTIDEFGCLLAKHRLATVERRSLLPRAYSPTTAELRRVLGRARRRMAVPDPRRCQAWLVRPA